MNKKYLIYISLLSISALLFSCKDQWDEHNAVTVADNSINLAQKIEAEPSLSVFNGYVKSTGYDKVLANSQNYTVWAPNNTAIASLDPTVVADPVKLKAYVGNHIALSTYAISTKTDTTRIKLLNDKFGNFSQSRFEDGTIIGSGNFVQNGVLYVVDQAIATKLNVWEYMATSTDATLQTNFTTNLAITVIDSANATVIGLDAVGRPILAPNPPTLSANTYILNVANLKDESQQFTYFMLQNSAFTSESARLASYYPSIDPNQNASFYLVKDLTVKGLYTTDKLPDTLLSVKGVKVPINKANIVKSYKASNGIVYVLSALPFRLKDKVPEIRIEGENPSSFTSSKTILYRTKVDNLGKQFKDIEVYNHGVSEYGVFYNRTNLAVVKYKVYARAIAGLTGDAQVVAFTQRYFFYNPTTLTYTLSFTHLVNPLTYTETLLGEYTPQQFAPLQMKLTAAASTGVNVNTLILDYVRFEPVLP